MKISQREIQLIASAIVNEVYDEQKINEQVAKEQEKAWKKFSSSKKWKDTLKILNQLKKFNGFSSIVVSTNTFFEIPNACCIDYRIVNEDMVKNSYFTWIGNKIRKQLPDKYAVSKRVETLLTIKALCGKDMESIMNDIINTVKGEYKL